METTHAAPTPVTDTENIATNGTHGTVRYPNPPSAQEREAMIQSLTTSWAIEGIHVSRDVAERAIEEALNLPLPDVG